MKKQMPTFDYENKCRSDGYKIIAGVDEVGRGSWAGPLVAAACILNRKIDGVRDSKLLSARNREELAEQIRAEAIWGIGEVSVAEINDLKLTRATHLAFTRAVDSLSAKPDYILVDGFLFPSPIPRLAIPKGDNLSFSIAAASIIAKVYRDDLMVRLDNEIKGYSFGVHKGYGTKIHQEALHKLGPSSVHRLGYKPIEKLLDLR